MIQDVIIGVVSAAITFYIILCNYKKMMIFNSNKIISIILFLILTLISAATKSLLGNFSVITDITTGILGAISLSLLIYIIFGKRQIKKAL